MAFVESKRIVVFMPKTQGVNVSADQSQEKYKKDNLSNQRNIRAVDRRSNSLANKIPIGLKGAKKVSQKLDNRIKSTGRFEVKKIQKNFNEFISGDLPKSLDFKKKRSLSRRPQHMSFRNIYKSENFNSKFFSDPLNHPVATFTNVYNMNTYLKTLAKNYMPHLKKLN